MTTANLIELLAIVVGGGGGGAAISKLTRLAVAVENLVNAMREVRTDVKTVTGIAQNHETRISTLEGVQQGQKP